MSLDPFFAAVAFIAGLVYGSIEILARYRDEPFKVLSSPFSWIYVVVNGLLGFAAYAILIQTQEPAVKDASDQLKYALIGGLGAAVVLRARLFSAKVGDEEIAIGPGYFVDQLLAVLDQQIDRSRAHQRVEIVVEWMGHLDDFKKTTEYVSTMILGSSQSMSLQARKDMAARIREIRDQPTRDKFKIFALGFVILDFRGEEFLKGLFKKEGSEESGMPVAERPAVALDHPALVRSGLRDLSFAVAKERFAELVEQKRTLQPSEREELLAEIRLIEDRDIPELDKSYALGFFVLDFFGREAFEKHFPPSAE